MNGNRCNSSDRCSDGSRNFGRFPKQAGTGLKQITTKVSDETNVVLQLMLQYDPDVRINVRRLLEHKYFIALREEEHILKYKHMSTKQYLHQAGVYNKNKGDYNTSNTLDLSADRKSNSTNKYKTTADLFEKTEKNKVLPPLSKTTIDIVDYKPRNKLQNHMLRPGPVPLVSQKQMKSWGVDPDILKPRDNIKMKHQLPKIKPPVQRQQHREKRSLMEHNECSKTTSYLPQVSQFTNTEYLKNKHFQSKSFIIPRRCPIVQSKKDDVQENINRPSPIKKAKQ